MVGGAALWLGTCVVLPVPPVAVIAGVPVAAYVALWPDIDSEQSTAARWLGPFTYMFSRWVQSRLDGHRYGMHSLLVGVPLCCLLATFTALMVSMGLVASTDVTVGVGPLVATVGAASLVGATSHPLLDFFTCNCGHCAPSPKRREFYMAHTNRLGKPIPGVAILWPWSRRRWGLPVLSVGSRAETQVVRPVLVGLAAVAAVFTVLGWA